MDNLRGHPDNAEGLEAFAGEPIEDEPARELPPAIIGQDERRMQVRAYNLWASMLENRNFPPVEALSPGDLPDFGPWSVLLDFTGGMEDPVIRYLGEKLGAECGVGQAIERNALADREAGALCVDRQAGAVATTAFALAAGADALLDLDGVARRVEYALGRGAGFHFLECDHVGRQHVHVGSHRGVVGVAARPAARIIALRQVFHVPGRQRDGRCRRSVARAIGNPGAGTGEQAKGGEQGVMFHARSRASAHYRSPARMPADVTWVGEQAC